MGDVREVGSLFNNKALLLRSGDNARGAISVLMLAVAGAIVRTKEGLALARELVFDGVFGLQLEHAIMYLQSDMHLSRTGVLDLRTLCALSARTGTDFTGIPLGLFNGETRYLATTGAMVPHPLGTDPTVFPRNLNQGSSGFAVLLLQIFLATYQAGQIHDPIRFTGKYGPKTMVRVEVLKLELGKLLGSEFEPNGNFDPATRLAIREMYGLDFDGFQLPQFGF